MPYVQNSPALLLTTTAITVNTRNKSEMLGDVTFTYEAWRTDGSQLGPAKVSVTPGSGQGVKLLPSHVQDLSALGWWHELPAHGTVETNTADTVNALSYYLHWQWLDDQGHLHECGDTVLIGEADAGDETKRKIDILIDWDKDGTVEANEQDEKRETDPGLILVKTDTTSVLLGFETLPLGAEFILHLPEDQSLIKVKIDGVEKTGTQTGLKASNVVTVQSANSAVGQTEITMECGGKRDRLVVLVLNGTGLEIMPPLDILPVMPRSGSSGETITLRAFLDGEPTTANWILEDRATTEVLLKNPAGDWTMDPVFGEDRVELSTGRFPTTGADDPVVVTILKDGIEDLGSISFHVFDIGSFEANPTAGGDPGTWETSVNCGGTLIRRPSPENTKRFKAAIVPNCVNLKMKFELHNVSTEPGACMNSGSGTGKDLVFESGEGKNPDADFNAPSADGQSIDTKNAVNEVNVVVTSKDYGPYGEIKFILQGKITGKGFCLEKTIKVLDDDDGDKADNNIEDAWDTAFPAPTGGTTAATDDKDNDPTGDGTDGDNFSRYEEYRGFMVDTAYKTLNPKKKDVFVVDKDNIGQTGDFTTAKVELEVHYLKNSEHSNKVVNFNRSYAKLASSQKCLVVENHACSSNCWGICFQSPPDVPNTTAYVYVYVVKHQRNINTDTAIDAADDFIPTTWNSNDGAIDWQHNGRIGIDNELINYVDHQDSHFDFTLARAVQANTTYWLGTAPSWHSYDETVVGTVENEQVVLEKLHINRCTRILSQAINDAVTTIIVLNDSSGLILPDPDDPSIIVINDEQMRIDEFLANNRLRVTRGFNGTTPAAHANNTNVEQYPTLRVTTRGYGGTAAAPHDAGKVLSVKRGFYGCARGASGTTAAAHANNSVIKYFCFPQQESAAICKTFAHELGHGISADDIYEPNTGWQGIMFGTMRPGAIDGNGIYHTFHVNSKVEFRVKP